MRFACQTLAAVLLPFASSAADTTLSAAVVPGMGRSLYAGIDYKF